MTTQIEKKNTVQAGQKTDGLKRLINRIKNIPAYTLLGLFAAFNIFVILWIIVTSFKSNRELYANVWSFPVLLQFVNYIKAWSVTKMDVYFVNSLIVVSLSVLLTLVVATPAAYVLTRISFKGSSAVTQFFTGGMGVPAAILFIPLFDMLAARGWVDSLPGPDPGVRGPCNSIYDLSVDSVFCYSPGGIGRGGGRGRCQSFRCFFANHATTCITGLAHGCDIELHQYLERIYDRLDFYHQRPKANNFLGSLFASEFYAIYRRLGRHVRRRRYFNGPDNDCLPVPVSSDDFWDHDGRHQVDRDEYGPDLAAMIEEGKAL